MKYILPLLLLASSCQKQTTNLLYCNVTTPSNVYDFKNTTFEWYISSNNDTVIELNNNYQALQIRNLQFTNTNWVGTFDSNQYVSGNILNKPAVVNYTLSADTMEGTASFAGLFVEFKLLKK